MKRIDDIFKIGMLIIAIVFVAGYYLMDKNVRAALWGAQGTSQNGRYQVVYMDDTEAYHVFDTQTGIIHEYDIANQRFAHVDVLHEMVAVNEVKKRGVPKK